MGQIFLPPLVHPGSIDTGLYIRLRRAYRPLLHAQTQGREVIAGPAERKSQGTQLICLYGYSLFCFLPALVVSILPLGLLQWVCLLYGLANSTIFLRASLAPHVEGVSQMVVTGVIGGTQFIFILCIKLIFLELLAPK